MNAVAYVFLHKENLLVDIVQDPTAIAVKDEDIEIAVHVKDEVVRNMGTVRR